MGFCGFRGLGFRAFGPRTLNQETGSVIGVVQDPYKLIFDSILGCKHRNFYQSEPISNNDQHNV